MGWLPGRLLLSGPLHGSGPAGGCSRGYAGPLAVSRGFVLAGGVGLSGDWCRKHACHAFASCLCGECGVVGAPACVGVACCRGSGAVRPGCLTCLGLLVVGGSWVGVGGLVVNCIVDASILL